MLQVAAAAKVKQNSSSGDAQLPVKTQKILDEKNELILKMREEIQANSFCSFGSSSLQAMKMTTKDLIDDESSSLSAPVLKRSTLMEVQVTTFHHLITNNILKFKDFC